MRILLAFGVTGLISCNAEAPEKKAAALEPKVVALEAKVADLEKRLDENAKPTTQHAASIAELQGKVGWLETRVDIIEDEEGTLDPTLKAYAFVKTRAGNLLLAVDNVVPFGDGQKVTFRVGNPHTITFNGFTMKVRYGPREPSYPEKKFDIAVYNAWQASFREKELKVTESLIPGKWNHVNVVLAPAKPQDIGSLGVRIAIDQVSLLLGR